MGYGRTLRSWRRMGGRWFAACTLALTVVSAPSALADDEIEIPTEDALWRSAGESFSADDEKAAALKQYRLFVREYGGSRRAARAHFMVGECLFSMGEFGAAARSYETSLGAHGRDDNLSASALLRLGECRYNLGEFDSAIESLSRVVDHYAQTFQAGDAVVALGESYIAEERWVRLDGLYESLIEERPAYADLEDVRFARGLIAYNAADYDRAVELLKSVESDRGLFFWGRALEDDGQFLPAVQKYKLLLRKYPDSVLADDAELASADAFFEADQLKLAIDAYQSFLEKWPNSPFYPSALYKLACVSYREGRYEEAVRSLEEVRTKYPQEEIRAYADYLIGNCHLELGNIPDATFAYTRVVEEFPLSRVSSAALHKMIFCYANDGNFAQTILLAEDFWRRYPGDPLAGRVLLMKGFAHHQLSEPDRAVREFQAVLDRHPGTDIAERALYLAVLTYYEREQYDRMITIYRHFADELLPTKNPWRAHTYHHLGEAYYALQLYQDASQMYRLVLTGYPRSDVAAYSLQGLTASLAKMGRYDEALEAQEKFLLVLSNEESENGRNQLTSGAVHFNQRDYEAALRSYESFLDDHPDDDAAPGALLQSGEAYYSLQYYEEAIRTWRTLIERFSEHPLAVDALYKIADTQFGLGRYAAAAQSFRAVLDRAPESEHAPDAAYNVANSYYNLRDDEKAIAAFQRFLEEFPDDDRVEGAQRAIQSAFYRSGRSADEYLEANPDSPLTADLLWQEGQQAFNDGEYTRAAERFRRVALEYPESESAPNSVFYLAESHYKNEDLEEALATYRNFASTYESHDLRPLAGFRIGVTYFKLEKYEEAVEAFESLLADFPTSEYAAMAAYNVTLALANLEDWPGYVEACERVVKSFPEHEQRAEALLQSAVVYQDEMGAYEKAIAAYEAALSENAGATTEIHYRIGECRLKLEDLDGALEAFSRAGAAATSDDPFRVAALAEAGEIHEKRADWASALVAYRAIAESGANPEWVEMAEAKIVEVEARAR